MKINKRRKSGVSKMKRKRILIISCMVLMITVSVGSIIKKKHPGNVVYPVNNQVVAVQDTDFLGIERSSLFSDLFNTGELNNLYTQIGEITLENRELELGMTTPLNTLRIEWIQTYYEQIETTDLSNDQIELGTNLTVDFPQRNLMAVETIHMDNQSLELGMASPPDNILMIAPELGIDELLANNTLELGNSAGSELFEVFGKSLFTPEESERMFVELEDLNLKKDSLELGSRHMTFDCSESCALSGLNIEDALRIVERIELPLDLPELGIKIDS